MKEYRSAIRSRKLIRAAFIGLLAEKNIEKITVVDVTQRADISRNTFYAHYADVYAVLAEIENSYVAELNAYLDDVIGKREIGNPMPLLRQIQRFIEQDIASNRLLLSNHSSLAFCEKLKRIFLERVLDNLQSVAVRDTSGFLIFVQCLACGFVDLYQKSITGETDDTLTEITDEVGRLFSEGIKLYI